jgi:hypothetical protein
MLAVACAALLVIDIPLTVRRPLTADCTLFDLEWRNFTRGGVLYRDIFQTNPPGTLWIHGFTRTCFGNSSEALRWMDLFLVGSIVANLALWMRRLQRSPVIAWGVVLVLIWLYGWQSIWCQCQRDLWMLAPCLMAVNQRWRRHTDPKRTSSRILLCSAIEGAWWGLAIWIKPFAIVPAVCVWIVDQLRAPQPARRTSECLGLLTGGVAVGALGIVWMCWAGCWPWFVDTLLNWNGSYVASRVSMFRQLPALLVHFGPWMLVHPLAMVVAIRWLWCQQVAWNKSANPTDSSDLTRVAQGTLAALYIGWMLQAFGLQHGHGYVHVPAIFLGIAVIAGEPAVTRARLWWPAVALVVLTTCWLSPLARFEHIRSWKQCVTGPIDEGLRMAVRGPLDRVYPCAVDEMQLREVAEYLRSRGVRDGEVCVYEYSAMRLYWDLDIAPPCRFICPRIYALRFFVDRRDEIRRLLEESPQRFLVTDLVMDRMSETDANAVGPDGLHAPPPAWPQNVPPGLYPWSHPVVFRSGRYLVHRLAGPMGDFTPHPPWRQ